MITAARELARIGPVMPVRGKVPLWQDWPARATRAPNGEPEWADATGVGLLTGSRAGYFVLDVDGERGRASLAALESAHGSLPPTWCSKTGSGGLHFFFRWPDFAVKGSASKLGPGLDIRGDHGQVVAPPSLHPSGTFYEWKVPPAGMPADAPAWLLEMLKPPAPRLVHSVPSESDVLRRAAAYLARIPGAVSKQRGHDQTWNAALKVIRGFALSEDDGFALLWAEYNPRCLPPWNEKQLRHKVSNVTHDGTVPWGFLRDAPHISEAPPPREQAPPSRPREPGEDDDEETSTGPLANPLRDYWHTFSEIDLATDPPPLIYVARPRIPECKAVVLSAAGGTGKTTLIVDLAYRRAVGDLFIDGTELRPGETVILTGEDSAVDFRRKLHALRLARQDFDAKAAATKIHILDVTGVAGVELVRTEFGQHVVTGMPDSLADLIKERAPKADLVIVETISRFGGGPETNDSHAQMVKAAERICRLAGAACLLDGHVSQAAGRAGVADQYAARGGTALIDNARSGIVMSPLTQENAEKYAPGSHLTDDELDRYVILTHPKSMGPKAPPVLLERAFNDAGAFFRLANLKYRSAQSTAQLNAQLRNVVAKYVAMKQDCTARKLRARHNEFGLSENRMEIFIDDAIGAGVLRQVDDRKSRGGGIPLMVGQKEVPDDGDA